MRMEQVPNIFPQNTGEKMVIYPGSSRKNIIWNKPKKSIEWHATLLGFFRANNFIKPPEKHPPEVSQKLAPWKT